MKICPACRLELSEEFIFCPEDGSRLTLFQAALPVRTVYKTENNTLGLSTAAPLLYCSVCSAEYPLTFTRCPLHGAPLTSKRIQTTAVPPLEEKPAEDPLSDAVSAPELGEVAEPCTEPDEVAQPQADPTPEPVAETALDPVPPRDDYQPERPELRVAAVATVIGLIVFGVIAVYTFVSNAARRPVPIASASVSQAAPSPAEPLFIPTPQAAQDYEPPLPIQQAPEQTREPKIETASTNAPSRPATSVPPPPLHHIASLPASLPAKAGEAVSLPSLPRGNPGRVVARVVRVHSTRIASGARYDVTFSLQEEAGQAAQLERLMIATYSASGVNRSQMIPFYHRLGAEGSLTFTISVEMRGRSDSDLQGRVICTSLGSDEAGRPLRTSFGANVSP